MSIKILLNNDNIDKDIFIHTWNTIDKWSDILLDQKRIINEFNPKNIEIEYARKFNISSLMHKRNFNNR